MENKNFTQKQIANWRRIAMNVNSDVIKRDKIQSKIDELKIELETLNNMIDMQEYPVKMATGGYTTSDIFVKNVVTTDKVDANGRALKKTTYDLKWPDTVLPPSDDKYPINGGMLGMEQSILEETDTNESSFTDAI